jgi:hypothetical protein
LSIIPQVKRENERWNSVKSVSTAKDLTYLTGADADVLCSNLRMRHQFSTVSWQGKKI